LEKGKKESKEGKLIRTFILFFFRLFLCRGRGRGVWWEVEGGGRERLNLFNPLEGK
jgi:hypothetical protein